MNTTFQKVRVGRFFRFAGPCAGVCMKTGQYTYCSVFQTDTESAIFNPLARVVTVTKKAALAV